MFSIELLPAGRGDCLLIEYGDSRHPHRILIDGGPGERYDGLRERILRIPPEQRQFELLVVTHIDVDHIQGVLKLLRERGELGIRFQDVWFNGFRHLPRTEKTLGPVAGEALTDLLEEGLPWNMQFGGEAIVVSNADALPVRTLPGGMRITLLSPYLEALRRLAPEWAQVVRTQGQHRVEEEIVETDSSRLTLGDALNVEALASIPFLQDQSKPNGSSIAFVAEFEGKRFLATGDAFPDILATSLQGYFSASVSNRYALDAFKPSHHGSRGSLNVPLLQLLCCRNFLISSDGSYFKHPTRETVARMVQHGGPGANLWFNYHSDYTSLWDDSRLIRSYQYTPHYPNALDGIRVEL